MPYPLTAALVAASTVSELTTLSTPQQDSYRAVAINAVQRYTGQRFEPSTADVVLDGGGARELYLPIHAETLTNVLVRGTSIDMSDVTLSDKGDRIYFAAWGGGYAISAMRETAFDTRTFRVGAGTVVLSGTFGWSVCPAAVFEALRIEMEVAAVADASALSGIVASSRRLGLRDISQGNLRASIGDPSTISPQAAALLADYVWTGQGGELV